MTCLQMQSGANYVVLYFNSAEVCVQTQGFSTDSSYYADVFYGLTENFNIIIVLILRPKSIFYHFLVVVVVDFQPESL